MNHSFQPKITKNYLYYRPHELWRRSLSLLTDTYPILIYNPIGVITVLKVEFQILSLSSKNYIVLKFECGKNKTWLVGKLYLKK